MTAESSTIANHRGSLAGAPAITDGAESDDSPARFHARFAYAFGTGDVERLLELYEPQAVLVSEPGLVVRGYEGIRAALAGLLAMDPRIRVEPGHLLRAGELALLVSRWTIDFPTAPSPIPPVAGTTSDVIRRQPDGTWRLVIDNPYGAAAWEPLPEDDSHPKDASADPNSTDGRSASGEDNG